MYLVGLTGGIGTGKSTVAKMLEKHGIPVVDADYYARKGSPELTAAFISLRSTHDDLFTKRRNSACHGYSFILQKLEESRLVDENTLTPRQLRKKWENLLKRYRKLKHAAGSGLMPYANGSESALDNWPFYQDMDQMVGKHEPLSHMLLSEPASNSDYGEEYVGSAKRFCSSNEECATVEVVEAGSPIPPAVRVKASPRQSTSRSEMIHRLINQHQRLVNQHEQFIALYERLVVALEKSAE